jgi:TolB-like protein
MTGSAPVPDAIGRYRVVRQIGRGGMGVVFEAVDERLGRPIAIKTILPATDPQVGERFLREARSAAAVSHPNICQLFEIGEHEGQPFLAMELLEGQSLAARIEAGALPPADAISIVLGVLSALDALHQRGIVHRDLKPSNVFLTPHGVKLLDFGLARPIALDVDTTSLTLPGIVLGTPRYMSPEQARGGDLDARTDVFAAGALLFELLSGRPAFTGPTAIEVLHAVLHDQPPALVGSLAIVEADRVIQRALAKQTAHRYPSAATMAMDLRACLSRGDVAVTAAARVATRLIVLPFRILKPDPAIDFLASSLPDAITVSLTGLESLVVRSSLVASRFAQEPLDLRMLSTEAGVDAVVTGTLLHAGGFVRVNVQLVEVPGGTVLWSHAAQVSVDDLFQIQDSVCAAVVEALALPLSSREQRMLRRDVPKSAEAYGHYLRANRLSGSLSQAHLARDLYLRAVDADPSYAPAWAQLGRCLRVMGKYATGDEVKDYAGEAEHAFQQAFGLNPDLSLGHHLYTHLEVETGRALEAVLRLLGRVRERTSDPDLYAGLVHACRYVGLLDASIAAHHRAKRLDPLIRTTVAHSFLMSGDYVRAIEHDADDSRYITLLALHLMNRTEEARELRRTALAQASPNAHLRLLVRIIAAAVDRDADAGREALGGLRAFPWFSDPEGWLYWAHGAIGIPDDDEAMRLLARAVDGGLYCVRALETSPDFDRLRSRSAFADLVTKARAGQARAAAAFTEAGGHRILGLSVS